MRTTKAALFLPLAFAWAIASHAQLIPSDCTNCLELNAWYFSDTNWLSQAGYSPVGFSNIVSITNGCDGNGMLLDTSNTAPAFLFYNIVETNKDSTTVTNITPQSGTLYAWLNPTWSSSNQSGTGPGDWADIISMGQYGTNGSSWWSWYISPTGNEVLFASSTNGGSPVVYLSAPVSFLATNWYNLTLTYGPTNCAFYTNGILVTNGTGVEYWPGPDVTYFAIGSDGVGYHQARAELSDVQSYNYPLDAGTVWDFFSIITPCYGLAGSEMGDADTRSLGSAPPLPDPPLWFTGLGYLQQGTHYTGCPINTNLTVVWLTNFSVALQTNGTTTVSFMIEVGSSNAYYDVFGCTSFAAPATNTVWAWLGQGQTCTEYTLTNLPDSGVFLMLGTPVYPTYDNVGLTIAFETLVSHTSTNSTTYDGLPNAWIALNGLQGTNGLSTNDPDQDGLNNMEEYLYGTKPLVPEGITPWVGNPSGFSGIP